MVGSVRVWRQGGTEVSCAHRVKWRSSRDPSPLGTYICFSDVS